MRLETLTRTARDDGRKALVPFFTAGYPDADAFLDLVAAAADAGCGVVEVGIPFSDPVADGPLIQASSRAALAAGLTLDGALDLTARATAASGAAAVLMSYLNPVLRMGPERFAARAAAAGAVGVILPDVPWEESGPLRPAFAVEGLALVDLLAPTTDAVRAARIAGGAQGFLYLVSITGVTGAAVDPAAHAAALVARARAATDLPCYVGFGVADVDGARRAARHADGVIVGSALMRLLLEAPTPAVGVARCAGFLRTIASALAELDEETTP